MSQLFKLEISNTDPIDDPTPDINSGFSDTPAGSPASQCPVPSNMASDMAQAANDAMDQASDSFGLGAQDADTNQDDPENPDDSPDSSSDDNTPAAPAPTNTPLTAGVPKVRCSASSETASAAKEDHHAFRERDAGHAQPAGRVKRKPRGHQRERARHRSRRL